VESADAPIQPPALLFSQVQHLKLAIGYAKTSAVVVPTNKDANPTAHTPGQVTNMSQRRFKHWIYLNDEGKKLYGEVFPDGIVPVVSLLSSESHYLLYHEELTPEQIDKLLKLLAERFSTTKQDIKNQMLKDRIPLRTSLTCGSGTNGYALFM
jgi:hypothetical protein